MQSDARFMVSHIGIHTDVFYKVHRTRLQFHTPYDAVPVALRLVGHAMRILSYTNILNTIIDFDGNRILTAIHNMRSQIVFVRHRQRHPVPHLHTIYVNGGLNVRPFEEQHNATPFPRLGHNNFLLIPSNAHVMPFGSEEEREFHLSFHPILLHVWVEIERRIVKRTRPLRLYRHHITLPVRQHRTRKGYYIII